jgi:hypothetical protein
MAEANRRKAERAIFRFISAHGGKLTDEIEREIARRFSEPR